MTGFRYYQLENMYKIIYSSDTTHRKYYTYLISYEELSDATFTKDAKRDKVISV